MKENLQCADCIHYEYDDYTGTYECSVDLDEDEQERFSSKQYKACPYYHSNDEYKTAKKQI